MRSSTTEEGRGEEKLLTSRRNRGGGALGEIVPPKHTNDLVSPTGPTSRSFYYPSVILSYYESLRD